MGRTVKRVPLEFDYPLNKPWYGYLLWNTCKAGGDCDLCRAFARARQIPMEEEGCPQYKEVFGEWLRQLEPPKGEGYQLWSTTDEESPITPVFATPEELAEYCEGHITLFADRKADRKTLEKMIERNCFDCPFGNCLIL